MFDKVSWCSLDWCSGLGNACTRKLAGAHLTGALDRVGSDSPRNYLDKIVDSQECWTI